MVEKGEGTAAEGGIGTDDGESKSSSSTVTTAVIESHTHKKIDFVLPGILRALKKSSVKHFQTLPPLGVTGRRKNKVIRADLITTLDTLAPDLHHFKTPLRNFCLADLQAATRNFSSENLIGEGGYAEVYKGILEDGQHVAVKRLTRGSMEEMTADFLSELGIIVNVDHPNIAKLIGYGVEGGMHLVLHFSPHGSLASIIQGSKEKLEWDIRYKIALGTAQGLLYLHEGGQKRIIHRDIKSSNILLTEDFVPQISDFGLAKWLPDQCTQLTVSKFEGTFGYLPPEFFMHGIVDETTDVFAFGVLLLELITGRMALDDSHKSLVISVRPLLRNNEASELVDEALGGSYDVGQLNRLVKTASLCLSELSLDRPHMRQARVLPRGVFLSEISLSLGYLHICPSSTGHWFSQVVPFVSGEGDGPEPTPEPGPTEVTYSEVDYFNFRIQGLPEGCDHLKCCMHSSF